MFFRRIGWVTLSVFILSVSGSIDIVESKTTNKQPAQTKKKQAKIEGFRSAKFGSNEKNIFRAIRKDFNVPRNKVKRNVHPVEKTASLEISVPDLLGLGGTARVGYVMGFKSKKLSSVNIVWGLKDPKTNEQVGLKDLVDTANFLRIHLMKKQYDKDSLVANASINDITTMVFRGKDKKGRMAVLVLSSPKPEKVKDTKKAAAQPVLKLTYIMDPINPDILTIGDDDF